MLREGGRDETQRIGEFGKYNGKEKEKITKNRKVVMKGRAKENCTDQKRGDKEVDEEENARKNKKQKYIHMFPNRVKQNKQYRRVG